MAEGAIACFKTCRKCGDAKPLTLQFFHRKLAGFSPKCKACVSAYDAARYVASGSAAKERAKQWRLANSERKLEANRVWARANKAKACRSGRESKARRRQIAAVRLNDAISANIRFSLRGGKAGRGWEALVGYSVADLTAHLERQFAKGMTWGNYGEWHIDHIQPVASFNFTSASDPEFLACWALTNLRPLWAKDNLIKSDKRLFLL